MTVHPERPSQQRNEIDLGLEVLHARFPRVAFTMDAIAAACGCTQQRIHQIEREALRKVRFRLEQLGLTAEDLR